MTWHAQGDAVQPRPRQITCGLSVADRHNQSKGAGPKGLRQGPGARVENTDLFRQVLRTDVNNQRIKARTALGFEDADDRRGIVGARAKTIDGLGRQVDQIAVS